MLQNKSVQKIEDYKDILKNTKLFLIVGLTFVFFEFNKNNFRTEYITENIMEDKDSKNPMKKAFEVNFILP